jgi:hypothetical protein
LSHASRLQWLFSTHGCRKMWFNSAVRCCSVRDKAPFVSHSVLTLPWNILWSFVPTSPSPAQDGAVPASLPGVYLAAGANVHPIRSPIAEPANQPAPRRTPYSLST